MSKRIKFYSLATEYSQKVCCRVNARALNKDTKLTCALYSSDLFTTMKLSVVRHKLIKSTVTPTNECWHTTVNLQQFTSFPNHLLLPI